MRRGPRIPTGIDRVERAYLAHLVAQRAQCFAIARTPLGYLLLNHAGMGNVAGALDAVGSLPEPDRLSRMFWRRPDDVSRMETLFRQNAVARCAPWMLRRMLGRHLPPPFGYLNVGHSNLTKRVLGGVKAASGQVTAFVHDIIPIEFPQFQRPGTPEKFTRQMRLVAQTADRVLYNSRDTQQRAESWMAQRGRVPPGHVAPLGISQTIRHVGVLPEGLKTDRPYFVVLGTIEPRKNHAFLLDLWEHLGPDPPDLFICGTRGWASAALFDRLDKLPEKGPVREIGDLSDAEMSELMHGAAGILFPSLAEGYGLPLVEARALGSRVLCNDLPALREVGDLDTVFHPVSERQKWLNTIQNWGKNPPNAGKKVRLEAPTWADHFKVALNFT